MGKEGRGWSDNDLPQNEGILLGLIIVEDVDTS